MNRSYKGNNSLLEVGHGETYVYGNQLKASIHIRRVLACKKENLKLDQKGNYNARRR
jgi:hypothetical protein